MNEPRPHGQPENPGKKTEVRRAADAPKQTGSFWRVLSRYILPAAVLVLYVAFAVVFSRHTPIYNPFSSAAGGEIDYEYATVQSIDEQNITPASFEGMWQGSQAVTIRVDTGRFKGRSFPVKNALNYDTNFLLHKGQKIVVSVNSASVSGKASVINIYLFAPKRVGAVAALLLLFFVGLCVIGRRRGFLAMLGIVFTLTSVFFVFIPLLLRGAPTVAATLVLAAMTACVTLFLVGGLNRKSLSAVLGTLAGLVVAILLLVIFSNLMQVSGYTSSESDALLNIAGASRLRVKGLFFAGIVIASFGAVMDIAISIASGISEVRRQNPSAGVSELFRSGMNMGRDMVGTMVNTLLLAFAGESVVAMILTYSYEVKPLQFANSNVVCMDVIEAVCGSFAVLLTVPTVSIIAARLLAPANPAAAAPQSPAPDTAPQPPAPAEEQKTKV